MPKIFEYFGLTFFFWVNEHLPIHVHVRKGEKQSTFELVIKEGILHDVKLRKDTNHKQLNVAEQRKAKAFIQVYYTEIISKWFKVFVLDIPVESEKIEKPIQIEVDIEKIIREVTEINTKQNKTKKE